MKKAISIICAVTICVLAAFCFISFSKNDEIKPALEQTAKSSASTSTAVDSSEHSDTQSKYPNINRASSSLDLAVVYRNEEEKLQDEKLSAIAGTVIDTEVVLDGVVYTCCTVKIDKVIKGSFDTDTIRVLERGGYLNSEQAEKFMDKPGAKSKNGMYVDCEGYVPASVGDKVIFYVQKCDSTNSNLAEKMKADNLYYTAGAIQGKMTLKNGKYVSATPAKLVESFKDTDYKISTKSFTPAEYEQMAVKTVKSVESK